MARPSYSLSNRSVRRRKVMLLMQEEDFFQQGWHETSPVIDSEDSSSRTETTAGSKSDHPPLELSLLHKLIDQKASMRWVFTGDSNSCSTRSSQETFLRKIEDHTKSRLHRDSDIFVNATYAGARLDHVRKRIQLRFAKFRPELVIVMCGFAECQSGVEKCSDFEMSFIALLKDIEKVGAIPIVCTPPHSDVLEQADGHIDRLIFLEAIRGCVAEHSGLLIDFWNDWEKQANSEQFWDANHQRPTSAGLERMQKYFLDQLGLMETARNSGQAAKTSPQLIQKS